MKVMQGRVTLLPAPFPSNCSFYGTIASCISSSSPSLSLSLSLGRSCYLCGCNALCNAAAALALHPAALPVALAGCPLKLVSLDGWLTWPAMW
jgi:hypothetical protein